MADKTAVVTAYVYVCATCGKKGLSFPVAMNHCLQKNTVEREVVEGSKPTVGKDPRCYRCRRRFPLGYFARQTGAGRWSCIGHCRNTRFPSGTEVALAIATGCLVGTNSKARHKALEKIKEVLDG